MIKFTSKIGTTMFLFFSFAVAVNLCLALVWGIFGIWIPLVVTAAISVLFVFPPFFGTYYYLQEGHLVINCWWFCVNKKIAYEDIVVAVPKQKIGFFPALSSDGIEIVYMKDGKTKQTFISPAMFEIFLNQLTDNIMVSNVMSVNRTLVSPETKQYLLQKQEVEEQKAKQQTLEKQRKPAAKKTESKPKIAKKEAKDQTIKTTKKQSPASKTKQEKSLKVAKTQKTEKPKTSVAKKESTKKAEPKQAKKSATKSASSRKTTATKK